MRFILTPVHGIVLDVSKSQYMLIARLDGSIDKAKHRRFLRFLRR